MLDLIKASFDSKNKSILYKNIKVEDVKNLIDILWKYMEDSDKIKEELKDLKERIKALNNKSGQRVKCLKLLEDRRALIQFGPIKEEVLISPSVDASKLKLGTEVLVIGSAEGRIISAIRDSSILDGRLSKINRILDDNRVVIDDNGNQIILKVVDGLVCKLNDEIRYDLESQTVLEIISSKEEKEFILPDTPLETFNDVKGLEKEKKYIYERIIYPIVYKNKFEKYNIQPIKGILLHGPSGCGKTILASAIFNEMIKLKQRQAPTLKEKTSYKGFFVINGPSVLNKWVGNTEATIRKIFREAKEIAKESDFPSIIFWDEIESIAGKRKDSATYTPEKTVVPTLLTELQGLEKDNNILFIAATNRPELLDPALIRPGRLGDIILEIPRPNKEAAKQILNSKFSKQIPEILSILIKQDLVEKIISHIYDNKNPIVTAQKINENISIYRKDMVNGALFANLGEELVRRTCLLEIDESNENLDINSVINIIDNILYMQLGILDSGVKNGFEFSVFDKIMDISLNT